MSIRWKLGILFLMISLVPLIIFTVIGLNRAQHTLKQEIGMSFELIAREKAMAVASVLNRRVEEAVSLANSPMIIAAVVDANLSRGEKDADAALQEIKRIDRAWLQSKGDIPMARNVLGNGISDFLRDYRDRDPLEYGEIFITDRLGATVAMTSTLTDYYQADEGWWREGFAGSKGAVYLDDRGYDLSVNAVVTGVVVPVRAGGEVAGLLKINFKMAHIPAIITNPYEGGDVRVFMRRSNGTAVIDPSGGPHETASETEVRIMVEKMTDGWIEDKHDIEPTIMGYALVQPENLIYSRLQAETSMKGVSGENWGKTNWFVFVERNRAKAYAPLTDLMAAFIISGVALAIVIIFVAGVVAARVTNPLLKLRNGMEAIASGNLDLKIGGDRKDEIGDALRDIDRMVERLKQTMASRVELQQEVEQRKQAELSLAEKSAALECANKALVNTQRIAHLGNWNLNIKTGALFWSDEIYRIFGQKPQSFKSTYDAFLETIHPDDRQSVVTAMEKALRNEALYAVDHRIVLPDGSVRHVYENGEVTFDKDGEPINMAGTVYDTTALKRAEESARKLSQAVEQSSATVIMTDTRGTIEYVNPKFIKTTGYNAEEVIGKNPRILKSGHTSPEEYKALWETIRAGKEWHGVLHNKRKDGTLYWESASISPIKAEDGTITNFLAIKEDITRRKQVEEQLIQSSKLATLGEMATGIAHELNQPLNIIHMAAESLLDEAEDGDIPTDALIAKLERIEGQTDRASAIINHMRTFGRTDTGGLEAVDLEEVAQDAVGLVSEQLRLSEIDLAVNLPGTCRKVVGQRLQLEQVVLNLLTNARDAIEAHEAGGKKPPRITIDITDDPKSEEVGLTVQDTGGGVPDEVLDRIFEPFFTTKEVGKGTGLGLSISYGIITEMGGRIEVANADEGARFTIFLPRANETSQQVGPRTSA